MALVAVISGCFGRKFLTFYFVSFQIYIDLVRLVMANTDDERGKIIGNGIDSEQLQATCVASRCMRLDFGRFIPRTKEVHFNRIYRCAVYYKWLPCKAVLIHTCIVTCHGKTEQLREVRVWTANWPGSSFAFTNLDELPTN
jgi:hypothetical protein